MLNNHTWLVASVLGRVVLEDNRVQYLYDLWVGKDLFNNHRVLTINKNSSSNLRPSIHHKPLKIKSKPQSGRWYILY